MSLSFDLFVPIVFFAEMYLLLLTSCVTPRVCVYLLI
jgi:hypothetical protein